jgi:adenosylhomocysteine nucleosidase
LFSVTPDALISTGYAGSLGVAAIGELVLGTQILDWTKERSSAPMCSSHALLEDARRAAREAGVGWTPGSVVTVDKVVWRASEKRALGEVSGAVAVDMESAAIAKVASAAGLPFLVARTISDRAEEDLPMDFNLWFSPYGSWRCLAEIARHPSILKGLFELNRQVSAASEGLRRFFCKLVPILEAHAPSPESATIGAR